MSHIPFPRCLLLLLAFVLGACGGGSDSQSSMSGESESGAAGAPSYQETPEAIEAGARLFEDQVCSRCHKAEGAPGIGPNLFDGEWLYGGEPDDIFASIMHGRPRGMASYEGRLSAQEVWHIVAWLRSTAKQGG
jgi:cytochrome c oxidase cbb3-type subunit III